jgi:hypothetical protein
MEAKSMGGMAARLERWLVVGDGLFYKILVVSNDNPPTAIEILNAVRCETAVITIFDALTDEFIGMAYASRNRKTLEEVR